MHNRTTPQATHHPFSQRATQRMHRQANGTLPRGGYACVYSVKQCLSQRITTKVGLCSHCQWNASGRCPTKHTQVDRWGFQHAIDCCSKCVHSTAQHSTVQHPTANPLSNTGLAAPTPQNEAIWTRNDHNNSHTIHIAFTPGALPTDNILAMRGPWSVPTCI